MYQKGRSKVDGCGEMDVDLPTSQNPTRQKKKKFDLFVGCRGLADSV
jgi:hypothetical protein